MAKYYCPLCKQEVTKKHYDEITGIWKERDKKLKDLEKKEKELKEKTKRMEKKFEMNTKKLKEKHQNAMKSKLDTQKKQYERMVKEEKKKAKIAKEDAKKQFEKKLNSETRKMTKELKAQQKQREKELKAKFEKQANNKFTKESKKFERERKAFEKAQRIEKNRQESLSKQFSAYRKKSEKKIKSLEEQLEKGKTPQVLGLLEEKNFLSKLREMFPHDRFEHPGKKGDIIHYVCVKGKDVGTIVYELKKVAKFSRSHVDQTLKAKHDREADYGILITNGKKAKQDFGFFTTKNIIVIHPAGALVLISIMREHIIEISKLKLSKKERNETIKAVLDYIRGPKFKNSLNGIVQDTIDLYENLQMEVKTHVKRWEFRLDKYRGINSNANQIDSKVINLLVLEKKKAFPKKASIKPIPLPEKID